MRHRKPKTILEFLEIALVGFAGGIRIASELSANREQDRVPDGIDPFKIIGLEKGRGWHEVQAFGTVEGNSEGIAEFTATLGKVLSKGEKRRKRK